MMPLFSIDWFPKIFSLQAKARLELAFCDAKILDTALNVTGKEG